VLTKRCVVFSLLERWWDGNKVLSYFLASSNAGDTELSLFTFLAVAKVHCILLFNPFLSISFWDIKITRVITNKLGTNVKVNSNSAKDFKSFILCRWCSRWIFLSSFNFWFNWSIHAHVLLGEDLLINTDGFIQRFIKIEHHQLNLFLICHFHDDVVENPLTIFECHLIVSHGESLIYLIRFMDYSLNAKNFVI